ncbi:MAG: orotidine 5'-phosphate decarboxylase [Treponema sp.]|jgi:3-hexulose-6-phosphate synthase|nr:orotidine 5'-phosphate decarboxylase [Treponema sp.]
MAIDRVSVIEAERIIRLAEGRADIIEAGTSLIKDFGLTNSVGFLKKQFPGQAILADMKTIDEGEYEFRRAFEAGADIATVMGAASSATIQGCQRITREYGRTYMIDLLGLDREEIQALRGFEDAVFCLHIPADCAGIGLTEMVRKNMEPLAGMRRIAAAGGVRLETIPFLKAAGIEIVIVGGAITKSSDITKAVMDFKEALN